MSAGINVDKVRIMNEKEEISENRIFLNKDKNIN